MDLPWFLSASSAFLTWSTQIHFQRWVRRFQHPRPCWLDPFRSIFLASYHWSLFISLSASPIMITRRIPRSSSSIRHTIELARSLATTVATPPEASSSRPRNSKLDDGLTFADFASGEPIPDRVTLGNTQQYVTAEAKLIVDLVCLHFSSILSRPALRIAVSRRTCED